MLEGRVAPFLISLLTLMMVACCVRAAEIEGAGNDHDAEASGGDSAPKSEPAEYKEKAKQTVYSSIGTLDEAGFTRMEAPKTGEWLSIHDEPPQTFEKYKQTRRVHPTPERKTIVLQPLSRGGEIHPDFKKALGQLGAYAESYFQLPVRMADPVVLKLPDDIAEKKEIFRIVPVGQRHGSYDRQFSGDLTMDELLAKKLPEDAMVYLGVTMEDIWTEQSPWVFGLGSFQKRVGVFSLARFIPEFWGQDRKPGDDVIALRRACRVMTHETGHMLGLSHCIFYHCEMNGAYTLEEADRTPMHECPLCHQKLQWNLGFDAEKRFAALQKFFEENKLTPEAEWMKTRLKNWKLMKQKATGPKEE